MGGRDWEELNKLVKRARSVLNCPAFSGQVGQEMICPHETVQGRSSSYSSGLLTHIGRRNTTSGHSYWHLITVQFNIFFVFRTFMIDISSVFLLLLIYSLLEHCKTYLCAF